jgi:hypothetical protein
MGWTEECSLIPCRGKMFFPFCTASRLALGPTQLPIQNVLGEITQLHVAPGLRTAELHHHSSIQLHDVVLK